MIATVEITKLFKSGSVDNSQVCCIADALVGLVDEGFASRFVNKQTEVISALIAKVSGSVVSRVKV